MLPDLQLLRPTAPGPCGEAHAVWVAERTVYAAGGKRVLHRPRIAAGSDMQALPSNVLAH